MKHALAIIVVGAVVACWAFGQEELDQTLLAKPPPSSSIEDRLREIDIELALEQYKRIQREAQDTSFELMKLDASGQKGNQDSDAHRQLLERRAMHFAAAADKLRQRIVEKYGKQPR